MLILGIDPGTATTGYGLIKVPDDIMGREFNYGIELVAFGNIYTPKERIMEERLLMIHNQLNQIVEQFKPEQMVIELLFFGANTKTVISVGQARGVIMLSAAKFGIPVSNYTAPQIKLMVAGSGRSDKNQVHTAVLKWLGREGRKLKLNKKGGHLDDATDAVAIAICHVLKLTAK